jgi:CBS domain-containing protein
MDPICGCDIVSEEDLRAALREMKTYVDITEEDLRKIYLMALKHARDRAASRITVREAMTEQVVTIRADARIREAAGLLSDKRISGLPVVDDGGRVIGVVTEADVLSLAGMRQGHAFSDIVRRLLGETLPEHKAGETVREVMTSPAISIAPDKDVREAAFILDKRSIKRLPVVDDSGALVGILSRGDIVRVMGGKTS